MCRFRPLQGVHLLAVGYHFEVEMGAGGAPTAPGATYDLSRLEIVAGRDDGSREVGVAGLYSVRVLDDYRVAVPSPRPAEGDAARRGRRRVLAVGRPDVDAPSAL